MSAARNARDSRIERLLTRTQGSVPVLVSNHREPSAAVAALASGKSSSSRTLLKALYAVASHPRKAVLVLGESGVGKTKVARAVHDLSSRSAEAFVRRDMTAIRKDFAVSELFGHSAGAYTGSSGERLGAFALAHRGSLFLDEIGKAELYVQGMLLAAIEDGIIVPLGSEQSYMVDVRVIAAANVPLNLLVSRGEFQPDLAARLEAFTIRVPPLRERRADIPSLVHEAVSEAAQDLKLSRLPTVSDELMGLFEAYDWPNNLRELVDGVARIVTEADGGHVLRLSHIPATLPMHAFRPRRRRREQKEMLAGLEAAGLNYRRAARELGISRMTLYRHFPRAPKEAQS